MTTVTHGEMLTLEMSDGHNTVSEDRETWPFGYMFPELQLDDANLLEDSATTEENLRRLGRVMRDPGETTIEGIPVPAIHTFFGQFVDHELTLERGSADILLSAPRVLRLDEIQTKIVNSRSPDLDLDSVYGPDIDGMLPPRDPSFPAKMAIAAVEPFRGLPKGKDVWHDFPRLLPQGTPLIGDSRNDENIIVSQLHIAFLRAHNTLITYGHRFEGARRLLRQHYQWIVLHDFLERIADPKIVELITHRGPRFFNPAPGSFFLPLEFSVAAYRFGHSKVRAGYGSFNELNIGGGLDLLFRPRRRLTDDWIIEWPSFLDPQNPKRFPRPLDPSLTPKLLELPVTTLPARDREPNLAIRNLIRGYILRMPTGQALAGAMGIVPMTPEEIASVASRFEGQVKALEEGRFLTKTPLWFYILAEAAFHSQGYHLGPVGSTIVAEVLIGVLRNSTDSILTDTQWRGPTLGATAGKFDLEDLLKLAGVF